MSEFNGKRYTTIVRQKDLTNCVTGEKTKCPDKYGVYDNNTDSEVYLPNFNPLCYNDVRNKAIELNKIEDEKQKKIGYKIGNVAWHNLDGYKELWRKADFDTKEHIVNEQGRLAIKLAIPLVSNQRELLTQFAVFMANNIERGKTPASLVNDFYNTLGQ